MNCFTKDTPIGDLDAGKIAGILQAQGGFFLKDRDRRDLPGRTPPGLLGIAQALHDMTNSRHFGTGIARVARYHFMPPKERWRPECLNAVEEVFLRGVKRSADWRILSLASFAECADRRGEPDEKKTGELRMSYDYLGKDSISRSEGIFYFGLKRIYRVCADRYILPENALRLMESLESEGISCILKEEAGFYQVLSGAFGHKEEAEECAASLRAQGYVNAKIYSGF